MAIVTEPRKPLLLPGLHPAYIYAWSTEATTPNISQLEEGVYSLVVRRHTRLYHTRPNRNAKKLPDGLEVGPGGSIPIAGARWGGGSIALAVKGGRAPYVYDWDHNADTPVVEGLGAGIYHVRVTDSNHCFVLRDCTSEMTPPSLP